MQIMKNSTVSFGRPNMVPFLIPVDYHSTPTCINNPLIVNGECYKITAMAVGSAHGAVLVDDIDNFDVPALGEALGNHPLFPIGANIVFFQVVDKDTLQARLWQQGEGESSFTSEAACVAGITAMLLRKTIANKIDVCMGGKTVRVNWDGGNEEVWLSGPEELFQVSFDKYPEMNKSYNTFLEMSHVLTRRMRSDSCLSSAR